MVELIKHAAKLCKCEVLGPGGEELYGGHSFRTSGACWLATLGIELILIQLHGRWKSSIVEHYYSTSPLAKLADKIRAQVRESSGGASLPLASAGTAPSPSEERLMLVLQELRNRLDVIKTSHDQLVAKCEELESGKRKEMFVLRRNTKRWHFTYTPELYSTVGCRWAYKGSDVFLQEAEPTLSPGYTRCLTCFPFESFAPCIS